MSAADEHARPGPAASREPAVEALPPDRLLPDTQPVYVASWIYVFGVLTLAAFAVVLASGAVIALAGPAWWHTSSLGHFVNSVHLWSTELFFFFMVVHLWGKFFMAAWRGRRALTWITGAVVVPGLDRDRVHRLPEPAELRLAMDRRAGEGRPQRLRRRLVLQRPQLRADAALARPAAAARRRAPDRRARPARAQAWGRARRCRRREAKRQ